MLMDKPVHHVQFGRGVIIAVREDAVFVNFKGDRGRGVTRKFLIATLFDDESFPKAKNAEVWATKGLGPKRPVKPATPDAAWAAMLAKTPPKPKPGEPGDQPD